MAVAAAGTDRTQAWGIYAVLCAGYVASQFYRVSTAVIAPELMRTLTISPEAMGLITGIFFLVFAAAQLPAGVLLDRFGPRRVMSGLFLLAIAGAGLFATAEGTTGLLVGRGLTGLGCAAGLMGSMVAMARWFPQSYFSQLTSLLYFIGGMGFLLATAPLAIVSEMIGWRGAFWLMAGLTGFLALLLYAVVRDAPPGHPSTTGATESAGEIWQGLKAILAHKELRQLCAMQFVCYATVLSSIGLWAGPYFNDIHGLAGAERGNILLLMNLSTLFGILGYAQVERWLNTRKATIIGGALVSAALLTVLAVVPGLGLWTAVALLVAFGLTSSYVMLLHAHARAMLPDHLIGRGMTFQNLAVFLGVFAFQAATGVIVGQFETVDGAAPELAYRCVYAFLAACTVVALFFYRHTGDVRPREQG
ncbi:MAG: MFS transporter [Alphaproteobacteria bacterium]